MGAERQVPDDSAQELPRPVRPAHRVKLRHSQDSSKASNTCTREMKGDVVQCVRLVNRKALGSPKEVYEGTVFSAFPNTACTSGLADMWG